MVPQFNEIALTLQAELSIEATLQTINDAAVTNIDSAGDAGIGLVSGRTEVTTPA